MIALTSVKPSAKANLNQTHAGVVELVGTGDLKSRVAFAFSVNFLRSDLAGHHLSATSLPRESNRCGGGRVVLINANMERVGEPPKGWTKKNS